MSPLCVTSNCTVSNCTAGGYGGDCKVVTQQTCPTNVPAPQVQYSCPGTTFNWQHPFKATTTCNIGVEGFAYLGYSTDATGQLDTTKGGFK